eukprot:318017_1
MANPFELIKKGTLLKQSAKAKQWRIRKVELRGHHLYSYHDLGLYYAQPTETIDLRLYCDAKPTTSLFAKNGQFAFELVGSNVFTITRHFIAFSEEEMESWVAHLKLATNVIEVFTTLAKPKLFKSKKADSMKIEVEIGSYNDQFSGKVIVNALYASQETISNIISAVCDGLCNKYHPLVLKIKSIGMCRSFTNETIFSETKQHEELLRKKITEYNINDITSKGLHIKVVYEQIISSTEITCNHMNKRKSFDPLQCPIYYAMKQNYDFTQDNLDHLNKYRHFKDEFLDKPACRHKDVCKAYKRLELGGNKMTDLCHLKLYQHPPRSRNIALSENINSLMVHNNENQNHDVYQPTPDDDVKYGFSSTGGFIKALIEEVIKNAFVSDLCLECKTDDECKHETYSILQIVKSKIKSHRHQSIGSPLRMDHMLALILYTGCDCNYDLCKSQRNGDYNKWKWFDYCLFHAIMTLSQCESGAFSVFSGLNKVQMDVRSIKSGYFVTYVSSSWSKGVAESFTNGDGMIIQIDKVFKEKVHCCDVTWISKFPDECEILFARSTDWTVGMDGFKCTVLNNAKGVQTVSLSNKD